MANEFITKGEILARLTEWKENTEIDIKSDWIDADKKADYLRQSTQLATMIGLLSTLGENGNIKE